MLMMNASWRDKFSVLFSFNIWFCHFHPGWQNSPLNMWRPNAFLKVFWLQWSSGERCFLTVQLRLRVCVQIKIVTPMVAPQTYHCTERYKSFRKQLQGCFGEYPLGTEQQMDLKYYAKYMFSKTEYQELSVSSSSPSFACAWQRAMLSVVCKTSTVYSVCDKAGSPASCSRAGLTRGSRCKYKIQNKWNGNPSVCRETDNTV